MTPTNHFFTVYPGKPQKLTTTCDDPPYDSLISQVIRYACGSIPDTTEVPKHFTAEDSECILIGTEKRDDELLLYTLQHTTLFDDKQSTFRFIPALVVYLKKQSEKAWAPKDLLRKAKDYYDKYITYEATFKANHNVWNHRKFASIPFEVFTSNAIRENPEQTRLRLLGLQKRHLYTVDGVTETDDLSIMTFNVQTYETALRDMETAPGKLKKIVSIIEDSNVDVVAIQEDLNVRPAGVVFQKYTRVAKCTAEQYYWQNRLMENSFLVHKDKTANDVDDLKELQLQEIQVTEGSKTPRCAVLLRIKVGGRPLIICNTHLNGGRWDDKDFRTTVKQKEIQLRAVLRRVRPHIFVGDFNGGPDRVRATHDLDRYDVFKVLSQEEKQLYLDYHTAAHAFLVQKGYVAVYAERDVQKTSLYGAVTDWFYVRKDLPVVDLKVEVINASDVSDHHAVVVRMKIARRRTAVDPHDDELPEWRQAANRKA